MKDEQLTWVPFPHDPVVGTLVPASAFQIWRADALDLHSVRPWESLLVCARR